MELRSPLYAHGRPFQNFIKEIVDVDELLVSAVVCDSVGNGVCAAVFEGGETNARVGG